jgi:hypothetical protein
LISGSFIGEYILRHPTLASNAYTVESLFFCQNASPAVVVSRTYSLSVSPP